MRKILLLSLLSGSTLYAANPEDLANERLHDHDVIAQHNELAASLGKNGSGKQRGFIFMEDDEDYLQNQQIQKLMSEGEQLQANGKGGDALGVYKKVYKGYPQSRMAPEALYQTGKIRTQRRQYADAFEAYQKIITDYPEYEHFNEVLEDQFQIASDLQAGKRPYYWGIIPGFRDYDGAIEYFESIVENAPRSEYAPMALMNIAMLAKEHKKAEDSIDALDRLVNDYPSSKLAPEAYILLADTYAGLVQGPSYDQGSTKEAINYYDEFLILYSGNAMVEEAEKKLQEARNTLSASKLEVGDFYYQYRNNPKAALIYYNEAITIAPKSESAEMARQKIGLIRDGVPAPMTIVDHIFGRYERPSNKTYIEEAQIDDRANTEFYAKSQLIYTPDSDPISPPLGIAEETVIDDTVFTDSYVEDVTPEAEESYEKEV